jgi:hypothetical protein
MGKKGTMVQHSVEGNPLGVEMLEIEEVRRRLDRLVEVRLAGPLHPPDQAYYDRLVHREAVLLNRD